MNVQELIAGKLNTRKLGRQCPGHASSICRSGAVCALAGLMMIIANDSVRAQSVTFSNVAKDPAMNLRFTRMRSHSRAKLQQFYDDSLMNPVSLDEVNAGTPHRTGGFPGVALLDHDSDGDVDIYVTNGPGAANALFDNQFAQTGKIGFEDISQLSGADATDLDSNGVCFGDLDNDGDDDLYVLGREAENRVYENLGGRFEQVHAHGAEAGNDSHISCSMGDIDSDGLLDIAVANVFGLDNALALVAVPYDLNQRNQLFRNVGNLHFADVSASAGIHNMNLGGTNDPRPPTISWAVSMVDVDLDDDIDIVFGDDQAALPNQARGGFDRGYLQIFLNDGTGHFSNAPVELNDFSSAAWMGLAFGDLDCNGTIDIFGSNFGSYMFEALGTPSDIQAEASRWLLGNGDGTFNDPQVADATAFGWGNAIADFDNDGDPDIVYHGAMDLNALIAHDNPGVLLENQGCTASFVENLAAFRGEYTERGTQGVATADLDRDGYMDVVSVSNHNIAQDLPFIISPAQYGSALDSSARFYLPMVPDVGTGLLSWTGLDTEPGDIAVEINDGIGQGSVSFRAVGSVDIVHGGRTNRSGIGATVQFTPAGLPTAMMPVVAGSSFTSQHALDVHFGMGQASSGIVDVRWPSGVRNRLYDVKAGERIVLPEIPCSINEKVHFWRYARCVRQSLHKLSAENVINRSAARRWFRSALRAFFGE